MNDPGAGELTEAVRFERRGAPVSDGAGNFEGAWQTLIGRRSAKLQATRGGEQVIAQRLTGTAPWDLWVRAGRETRAVTQADRVVDLRSGRVFNIRAIAETRSRAFLFMQLELGVATG